MKLTKESLYSRKELRTKALKRKKLFIGKAEEMLLKEIEGGMPENQ